MKQANAKQFSVDWEYESERRKEKKHHAQFRKLRQGKRGAWQALVE